MLYRYFYDFVCLAEVFLLFAMCGVFLKFFSNLSQLIISSEILRNYRIFLTIHFVVSWSFWFISLIHVYTLRNFLRFLLLLSFGIAHRVLILFSNISFSFPHSNKIRDRAQFGSQLNIDNRRERFALKGEKSLQSYIVHIYKQFTYVHTYTYI